LFPLLPCVGKVNLSAYLNSHEVYALPKKPLTPDQAPFYSGKGIRFVESYPASMFDAAQKQSQKEITSRDAQVQLRKTELDKLTKASTQSTKEPSVHAVVDCNSRLCKRRYVHLLQEHDDSKGKHLDLQQQHLDLKQQHEDLKQSTAREFAALQWKLF
jgi:hypothetical protein